MPDILATLSAIDGAARTAVESYWNGDDDGAALRAGFLVAGTFARFCAHAQVAEAERATVAYVTQGVEPLILRLQRMASVRAMSERYKSPARLRALYGDKSAGEQLTDVCGTYGIAACKGAFWLAVAGFSDLPCIDTHIASRYGVDPEEFRRLSRLKPATQSQRYFDLMRRIANGSPYPRYGRMEQWSDYAEDVAAFRDGGHERVTSLVIDAYRGKVKYGV